MFKSAVILSVLGSLWCTALCGSASAGVIVGGSELLSAADADQLENWLGEGPIQLTNIYTKQAGDDSLDFHAAVDGRGRTFSVIEVLPGVYYSQDVILGDRFVDHQRQVIGGYNPQSWDETIGDFRYTPDDADRKAFLFNMDTDEIQRQQLGLGYGEYQTSNHWMYGPTFGVGYDIHVGETLNDGYALNYSYGAGPGFDSILAGTDYYLENLQIGKIEVFTIEPLQVAPVPELTSAAAWSLVAVPAAFILWRRRAREARRTRCSGS
jgi:hypothetical protein